MGADDEGPSPPPPPPPPPSWGAPPPPSYSYAPPQTDGKAVAALVCAVASFVIFPFFPAVVAVVLASSSRKEIAASGGRLTGESLALSAFIVGWINIVLCILGLVVMFAVLVLWARDSSGLGLTALAVLRA
jgi:Domain of unknown function (DUF4190)